MKVKFWGVRGSLPAPLKGDEVRAKIIKAISELISQPGKLTIKDLEKRVDGLPFATKSTFGGNTTCIQVICDDIMIVLDLGSGLRELGNAILPQMFDTGGMKIHFLMSHIHWDHVQGFPFFAPIFISRKFLPKNKFIFFGGTTWQKTLEEVLKGQMDPPTFPIEWNKIIAEGPSMEFHPIFNDFKIKLQGKNIKSKVIMSTKRLHHPNETYGWRIQHKDKVFAFASDTEPYPCGPDPALINLAQDADLLYLDGQYTQNQYMGKDGPPRFGWGHGYDVWCSKVAKQANVKKLVLGHHDPSNSDEKILEIVEKTQKVFPNTEAAYEGLIIEI